MIVEKFKLKGSMVAINRKADGLVEIRRKDNLIVSVGVDFICNAIGLSTGRPDVMSHIGVGQSATAPASGQTDLLSPLLRKAATYAHTAGQTSFTFTVTYGTGEATGAITEAGVFNAASAGIMLDRVTFGVINKDATDVLTVAFTFTLTQS